MAVRVCSRIAMATAAAGLLSLSLIATAGCSSGPGSSASPSAATTSKALEGKVWKAAEISGVATILVGKGTEVTAEFSAGALSGSGGVNRYTATYETKPGDEISISQPAGTLMGGSKAAMAQEQAYFAALVKAAKYTVTADSLALLDDQGTTLVRYVVVQPTALEGTEWDALAYNNGKGGFESLVAGSTVSAKFGADGSLGGKASVNSYTTTYMASQSGDGMTIDARIIATKTAGPADLMRQEQAYLAALPKTATFSIEGDELWLRDATGAALAHYAAK